MHAFPAWLGWLVVTTTGAAMLLAAHLARSLWRGKDVLASGGAGLGLGVFAADLVLGFRDPSLHRGGAYALAAVYLLNLLYVIVKGDRVALTLLALGSGLLLAGIGLARAHLGGAPL